MEQWEFLNALNSPAFVVKEGTVIQANAPALQRSVETGTPIAEYICDDAREYESFSSGKLCLGLKINSILFNASVTCVHDYHLFCLDSEYSTPEFQAFSLAAQHLREPLSGAILSSELLLDELKDNDTAMQKFGRLNKNLHRLLRAVTNMSDVALYSARQFQNHEVIDLAAVVREIFEKAANFAQKANRKMEYKVPAESIYSSADRQKLERGILNMLSNAFKYSQDGSTVLAEFRHIGNRAYITVENNINQAITDNPFTRYLREPGIECCNNGIGLGMAIVQSVAISHGGTVLIEQPANAVKITMAIAIQESNAIFFRSPVLYPTDYAGGIDKTLLELSDVLPDSLFTKSE